MLRFLRSSGRGFHRGFRSFAAFFRLFDLILWFGIREARRLQFRHLRHIERRHAFALRLVALHTDKFFGIDDQWVAEIIRRAVGHLKARERLT